jgi:hypothetical protein
MEIDMSAPASWWDDDPALARLRFDSALRAATGSTGAAGWAVGRPGGSSRVLTFVACRVTLELEVRSGHLRGRLLPAQRALVTVRCDDGRTWDTIADGAGRFAIDEVLRGAVRLRLDLRVDEQSDLVVVTEPVAL